MTVITQNKSEQQLMALPRPMAFFRPAAAIIRREVGRMLQERAFRILVVGLTAVNVLVAYWVYVERVSSPNIARVAQDSFLIQVALLYVIGIVFTAARAGTCIGTERTRDTWTMMWMTPAHPLSIAIGHILAALAPATLMTLSQLPVFAPTVYALGNDQWPTIIAATAVGYTSWIACAAWAFWSSAQFQRFERALAGTFLAALWSAGILTAMLVGLLVLISSRNSPNGIPSFYSAYLLMPFSPVMQIYQVVFNGRTGSPVAIHITIMLACAWMPLLMGARAIRHEREIESPMPPKRLSGKLSVVNLRLSTTGYLQIPDWKNPIFAAEQFLTKAGKSRTGGVLFLLFSCFAMYMSYGSFGSGSMDEASAGVAIVFLLALGMAAWSTASGVAASQEHQTFDMVAMTGLRARDIQRGRVLSALSSVMPLVLLLATCMIIAGLVSDKILLAFVSFITFLLCIAMLLSSGLFVSVVTRGSREAIASNVLIGLIMYFGVPLICVTAYLGFHEAVVRDWLGLQRWFQPAYNNSRLYDVLAGSTSPITGLLQLLRFPDRWQAWQAWSISGLMALAWTILWYNVAGWTLRCKLEGRPSRLWRTRSEE